jgi:phi13 family phage major tail protein
MTDYTMMKGVDKLYYALVTTDDAGAYAADAPVALAPLKLAVQTPASASQTEYFDNQPFLTLSSEGETKIKVDVAGMPLSVQAAILGKVYDSTTESLYDNGGTPPNVALGWRAKNSDGTYTLYWFLKGNFMPFEEEAETEGEKPVPKGLSLEYTAVRTVHEFVLDGSITASVKRRVSRKAADVATWFDAVRSPSYGAPSALTCTPSPVDGAAAQSTSVAITLTFANPIRGGAENGVMLVRADTAAAIAVTRSMNAARTVLTLAHATLTAAKTYHIALASVYDVYGQALGDTVYDFATA